MSEARPPVTEADCEALLDAATKLMGIAVDPCWRAAVLANLKTTADAARFVEALPLDDELDPAPVFTP